MSTHQHTRWPSSPLHAVRCVTFEVSRPKSTASVPNWVRAYVCCMTVALLRSMHGHADDHANCRTCSWHRSCARAKRSYYTSIIYSEACCVFEILVCFIRGCIRIQENATVFDIVAPRWGEPSSRAPGPHPAHGGPHGAPSHPLGRTQRNPALWVRG